MSIPLLKMHKIVWVHCPFMMDRQNLWSDEQILSASASITGRRSLQPCSEPCLWAV